MRSRHWPCMKVLTFVIVTGGLATLPSHADATGKKVQSPVVINKTIVNGVVVSFTANGSLGSARSDAAGASVEEIGCWTNDGVSLNCMAVDGFNKSVECVVDDEVPGGGSHGYMARFAAINGDSYIRFSGQVDDPTLAVPGYICTGLLVANQSIYDPKQP
jgi:hypothetical protein